MSTLPRSPGVAEVGCAEPAEIPTKSAGRGRVKPRHLSPVLRQMILEQFMVRESTEDVAELFRVSARTVTDIVLLAIKKPPTRETGFAGERQRRA